MLDAPTLSQLLQWAVGLALYNPILQWSGRAEHNVLQPHCVAALQWAESNVSQPPLPQLCVGLWAYCFTTPLCSGLSGLSLALYNNTLSQLRSDLWV